MVLTCGFPNLVFGHIHTSHSYVMQAFAGGITVHIEPKFATQVIDVASAARI